MIAEYGLTGVNLADALDLVGRAATTISARRCAGLVLAAGLAAITVRGARDADVPAPDCAEALVGSFGMPFCTIVEFEWDENFDRERFASIA